MHLTDEQLNEYLDNESTERAQIEAHLSSCEECAARLTVLQALFAQIESLPELDLSRSLREASLWDTAPFTRDRSLSIPLPRWLTLTATLQAAVALIAILVAAPWVMELVSPYVSTLKTPTFAEIFLQLQSEWIAWLDAFSQLQIPALPEIPVVDISSLVVMLTIAGVSALWLVGNGLLLRKQIK